MNIQTNFAGLNLKSPVIVGSCALTGTDKHFKDFEKNGAGAIVLKSLFEEEIVFEHEKIMTEAQKYGYKDENLDYLDYKIKQDNINKYIDLIKKAKATVDIPVIASINCVSSHEWLYFTKKIEEAGADALELNIFLLPSDLEKSSQEIEETYIDIIKKVRENVKIPLIIKMSSFFTGLANMIKKVSETGVNGIVLFNRYFTPDIDTETKKIVAANIFSRPEESTLPLRWIAITSGKINTPLAASTGVHDGQTLIKMLLAGASAVEVVSTIYKNGVEQIQKMNNELSDYMNKNDFNNLKDMIGLANQMNVENPAVYERVQFMRYFSDREDIL